MPHVFVNRYRFFSSSAIPVTLEELRKKYFWESVNAIFYVLGGILLTIGSILFLPQYEDIQYVGAWIFIVASCLYLTVSGHDLIEINNHGGLFNPNHLSDLVAATSYLIGAINFILGSVFFLPHVAMFKAGAINFIMGSVLFVVGAIVNSIQIFDSPTRLTAFYANLVAVFFVVGSTFYLSASVPYLFELDTTRDNVEVDKFAAILYIWGSLLFTFAGFLNIYRTRLILIIEVERHKEEKALAASSSNNNDNAKKTISSKLSSREQEGVISSLEGVQPEPEDPESNN
ncbi:expressed unknown protein [Seminavis robusta]|uniref:YrhK domain-containing protein n=1 Tax=Seminavis robusta TaxID=568900 RepID=A0A9N8DRY5_9STRA|nr:expressed unknown protein [Seminavis robusta]|eukprot:Sro312_g114640.1 n/a (287) ;mRNA; f:46831-47807